jgi:hypothetical protein
LSTYETIPGTTDDDGKKKRKKKKKRKTKKKEEVVVEPDPYEEKTLEEMEKWVRQIGKKVAEWEKMKAGIDRNQNLPESSKRLKLKPIVDKLVILYAK